MSLDAVQLAHSSPQVDTFAVTSSDTDFSALIARLRHLGRDAAIVTVGRSAHLGMNALLALGTSHIVYDQSAIDAAGFDPVPTVLASISPEKLHAGVRLPVIGARLQELAPDLSQAATGFRNLTALLERLHGRRHGGDGRPGGGTTGSPLPRAAYVPPSRC